MQDLRHPNRAFLRTTHPPLSNRHPVAFRAGIAALPALALVPLFTRLGTQQVLASGGCPIGIF